MNNKKHVKKGFTLVELVIVIAIIGVLTGMIVVAWNRIINKQRLTDANTRAKIIFNAAQTEAIKYSTTERNQSEDERYLGTGDFYLYWDGGRSFSGPAADNTGHSDADDRRFTAAINRILSENGSYKVYIRDYVVQSVVYQENNTSRFMGAYPASPTRVTGERVASCSDMVKYALAS